MGNKEGKDHPLWMMLGRGCVVWVCIEVVALVYRIFRILERDGLLFREVGTCVLVYPQLLADPIVALMCSFKEVATSAFCLFALFFR